MAPFRSGACVQDLGMGTSWSEKGILLQISGHCTQTQAPSPRVVLGHHSWAYIGTALNGIMSVIAFFPHGSLWYSNYKENGGQQHDCSLGTRHGMGTLSEKFERQGQIITYIVLNLPSITTFKLKWTYTGCIPQDGISLK